MQPTSAADTVDNDYNYRVRAENTPLHAMTTAIATLQTRRRSRAGFSLMELMMVMVLMAVLTALILTNTGSMRGVGISNGGNQVLAEMSLARETAIAKNLPVELWFIRKTGGNFIEATVICVIEPAGNPVPATPVRYMPREAPIDSGTLSPIVSAGSSKVWSGSVTKPRLAGFDTSYDCWYVRFQADGSTTLNIARQWYVTIHDRSLGDNLAKLPDNYAVVSVSPTSGRMMLERP